MSDHPANQCKAIFTNTLNRGPYRTPNGMVLSKKEEANFGTPSGGHPPVDCWVYEYNDSLFRLLFGFYKKNDFICKVVLSSEGKIHGQGASIQFSSKSFKKQNRKIELYHEGRVTREGGLGTKLLCKLLALHATIAVSLLGHINFPLFIGSTANIGHLIDRLFLYAYAIEQAKRGYKNTELLPSLNVSRLKQEHLKKDAVKTAIQQGMSESPEHRKAVEARAMMVAYKYLSNKWPTVEDVSNKESYDYYCTDGTSFLYVEVKGTTNDGAAILLTKNEVEHAQANPDTTMLIVVSRIKVIRTSDGIRCDDGALRVLTPWKIDKCDLIPMSYVCKLY